MIETEKIFKYRIKLSKSRDSLPRAELRRMLSDAIIKSGINYAKHKTWPKIALGPCAPDGEASISEYADICLKESIDVEELKLKLSPYIEGGFKIEEINEIPYSLCSLESLCEYAGYILSPADETIIEKILHSKAEIEILHENGIRELKKAKYLIQEIKSLGDNEVEIIIKLSVLRSFGLERILSALLGLEVDAGKFNKLRRALYWQSADGSLQPVWQEKLRK